MQKAISTVLITGASNGIGAALAQRYAAPNVHLGLIGRDPLRMQHIADDCQARGASVEVGLLDVTDTASLQAWIMDFDARHPVDLVIANAGITNHLGKDNAGESAAHIRQLFDVNLHGAINTIHPLIAPMRQRQQGQIALVSSLAAWRGMPVTPAYSASKAALKSYGEALRGWLAPEGVKVNVICPGFVKSDLSDHFPGSRPFMLSAGQAAQRIQQGLAKNRAIIAFPFPLTIGMWFVSVLPFPIASFFLGLSGYNRA